MRSRRRVTLAASFVVTFAALPACDNTPKFAPTSESPNPPEIPMASVDPAAVDASAPPAIAVDAGDDGAAPFRRRGPIMNPPRPRPMPSGN